MNNKVNQINNQVSGDQAGRDINKNQYIYHGEVSALRRRSDELKTLYSDDNEFRGFVDRLQKYMSPVESSHKVRDLKTKLTDGKREDLINEALKLKEEFSKKMSRNQFSEQAQELFAHILANINTFFKTKIVPMIKEGESNKKIDSVLYDELIQVIYNDIGNSKLGIDTDEIRGMIFYLTGNCHLEWDK